MTTAWATANPPITGQVLRELWEQLPDHGWVNINQIHRQSASRALRLARRHPRTGYQFPTYSTFLTWYLGHARLRNRYKEVRP